MLQENGFISPCDLGFIYLEDDPEEVISIIRKFYPERVLPEFLAVAQGFIREALSQVMTAPLSLGERAELGFQR